MERNDPKILITDKAARSLRSGHPWVYADEVLLRSFFRPDTSVKQMTETLVKAMDFYNKHLARQRKDRDSR